MIPTSFLYVECGRFLRFSKIIVYETYSSLEAVDCCGKGIQALLDVMGVDVGVLLSL